MVEFLTSGAAGAGLTWLLTEIVGKFLLKNLDKSALASIAALLIAVGEQLIDTQPGFSVGGALGSGLAYSLLAQVGHDKLERLLILGKNEVNKESS